MEIAGRHKRVKELSKMKMGWIRNTLTALTLSVAMASCTPNCDPPKDSPKQIKKLKKECRKRRDSCSKLGDKLQLKDHYFFTLKGDYCKSDKVVDLRIDLYDLLQVKDRLTKLRCYEVLVDAKKNTLKKHNMPAYRLLLNRNWCRGEIYKIENDIRTLE